METVLEKTPSISLERGKKKYKIKKKDHSQKYIWGTLFIFLAAFVYFVCFMCEYKWDQVRLDLVQKFVGQFFAITSVPLENWIKIFSTLLNTLLLSIVTTIVSIVIGLFLGLFSARNLSNPILCTIIRGFAGFIRAVPTIIWVLLFVSGFGLTATTALVGMCFHSVAYFIKSYSEAFEEVNDGTLEALRATGASWWQIVINAVLPSSFTRLLSWIAMRSEMNFAAAVVIGPAVGVPGTIGSLINKCGREGNYAFMGACILMIILAALAFELFITRCKQKSIVSEG